MTGVHLCPRPRRRTELYGPGRTVTLRAADSWPCQVIRSFAGDRALISSGGPPTRPRKRGSGRERLPGPPRRGRPVERDGRLVLRDLVPAAIRWREREREAGPWLGADRLSSRTPVRRQRCGRPPPRRRCGSPGRPRARTGRTRPEPRRRGCRRSRPPAPELPTPYPC